MEPFFITRAPRGRVVEYIESRGWDYRAYRYRGWAVDPSVLESVGKDAILQQNFLATQKIVRQMRDLPPDLVVTNTLVAPWGALAAHLLDIPHAWFVREFGDLDHNLHFLNGRDHSFQDIVRMSRLVVANSESVREYIRGSVPDAGVDVMYPPVDVEATVRLASDAPAVPAPAASPLKVINVGRITREKGQWKILEAMALLTGKHPDIHLTLVGAFTSPEYRSEFSALIEKHHLGERVTLLGELSNPFPHVAGSDVCVTSADNEAFGRTTLEYMALGKPVVASASGGSRELVTPDVNGFLFSPQSASGLASGLSAYLADPSLAIRHGEASRQRARQWNERGLSFEDFFAKARELVTDNREKAPQLVLAAVDLASRPASTPLVADPPQTGALHRVRGLVSRVRARLRRLGGKST